MVAARLASGVPRKGSLLPRSFLARPRTTSESTTSDVGSISESTTSDVGESTTSDCSTSESTTSDVGTTSESTTRASRSASILQRVRASRGTALRAGAGAVLLLGVTAAVAGMTETSAAVPAQAVDTAAVSTPVPTTDALGNPALRQQSVSAATRAQVLAQEARARAAQEAARSAARERVAVAKRVAAEKARQDAARKVAARAAAQRAAAARAAAARAAKVRHSAPRASVPSGSPRSIARALLAARGWSGQFGCLDSLFNRESGWNPHAMNPSSGAYGIPQALPGGKMASAGSDWRTNPATQIRWGLSYIASTYGTPCGAWAHSQSHGWY